MAKVKQKNKPAILDLADYKLPDAARFIRIYDTIPHIIKESGFDIYNYQNLFSDEKTKELIRTGNTIGCFYIESPGMRWLLKCTNCETFEMLTAVSSVIRPGVAESGMMREFIERHKDPKRRKYLVPEMEKYLGETYGVMIYQEDVIKVAYHIVGLSLEEADLLRRAMSGKMRSHNAMQMIIDKFFDCCKNKGYSNAVAQLLWKQIESFAGYAFCKAHSASFALLSFQVAYLKAHYPASFMAAVLTNQGGYYSSSVYISEAKRLGINVLLPSVNESLYEYKAGNKEIRIGLMAVKNLEVNEADTIIKEREANGKYVSLADFLVRTKLGYEHTQILIKCGAMDCLNQTRVTLLRLLDIYFTGSKLINENDNDLFFKETIKLEKEVVTTLDFSIEEKCLHEYETFNYMVSRHPLEFFPGELYAKDIVPSSEMLKYNGKKIKMMGWYMASKRIMTKNDEVMKFLSLEDLTGTFEAVIFPEAYKKYAALTMSMGPYRVEGKVDAENGNNIVVEKLEVLTSVTALAVTEKDRNTEKYYGDTEKEASPDEAYLVAALGKEKLLTAYL